METRNSSLESNVVVDRIKQLLAKKGATELDLTEYLGIHPNTVKNWRKNRSDSYLHYLKEISEYFNVTPNYLILGNDGFEMAEGKELFSKDELRIIDMYRKLKCDNKKFVAKMIELLLLNTQKEK